MLEIIPFICYNIKINGEMEVFMGTTHVRVTCPKCGFSFHKSMYGYVEDPIGIPLIRCPKCLNIYRDRNHKEWIQMSPMKKYFSIAPRGNFVAIFLAFIPIIAWIDSDFASDSAGAFWMVALLSWAICDYIIISIQANSDRFRERLAVSLARTRDSSYENFLSRFGKLYGEDIPRIIIVTQDSRLKIEREVEDRKSSEFIIPTFWSGFQNY